MGIKKSFEVAVVGGGPAGTTAACFLAMNGVSVALIEKAVMPRYKPCGGGIVGRALPLLPEEMGDMVERACYSAEMHLSKEGLSFFIERSEPVVSMVMRDRFDFLLLSLAIKRGAHIFSPCELFHVSSGRGGVELDTSQGVIYARFVIGADGGRSVTRNQSGFSSRGKGGPALALEIEVDDRAMEKLSSSARFDVGILPSGYGWVFPKKRHLSIGLGILGGTPSNLNEGLSRYVKVLGITSFRIIRQRGSSIPLSPGEGSLMKGRVLLVGDAAGFADPLLGEGITHALKSGQIAGESLLEGEFVEERVREAYTTALEGSLMKELRISYVLARILYDHPRLRKTLFSIYGQSLCEAVTDVIMGKRTYREIVRSPRSYLRLPGFFRSKS